MLPSAPRRRPAARLAALTLALAALAACGDDSDPEPPAPPAEVYEGFFAEGDLGTVRSDASAEHREIFDRGEQVAVKRFTPEEGLGPKFNVTFCAACHERPVFGGSGPRYRDFYIFGQELDDGSFIPGPLGGVSHAYALGQSEDYRPGRRESYNVVGRRNAIPFFGVGALAEVDEDAILANADPEDADGDGVSGRPNYDQGFVGRFGRKAQTVSIEGFIRGPLNNHLGVTTDPLTNDQKAALPIDSSVSEEDLAARSDGLTTVGQPQAAAPASPLFDEDDVPDPEMSGEALFDLVSWAMLLGAPRPAAPTEASARGEAIFSEVGCAACHVPTLASPRGLVPAYSDLLLHDMGEANGDGLQAGLATGTEFRTQPLWGISATGPYLHDGRADTIDQAIEAHGGEGEGAREAWRALPDSDKGDLMVFLVSLGGADQYTPGLLPPATTVPGPGEPGAPIEGLDEQERVLWIAGRDLFDRDIPVDEGLGPLFNGDSCRACHFDPVIGGAGPLGVNAMRYGTWEQDAFVFPEDGTLIHKLSSPDRPRIEPGPHQFFEPRQTPTLLGLGAIGSIPDDVILANADPEDADGDGVRGVAHLRPDERVGRFGWKGGVPTLRDFVRDALINEVGLTLPEDPGSIIHAPEDSDAVADPEVSVETIDALTFYIAALAPPQPTAEVPGGLELFTQVGCATCHIPTLEGAEGPVHLYSDLLLHDVAPADALGIPDGAADERQFRTSPLWGISHTAPFMHDGLATTLEDAIAAHHSEGASSRQAYEALSAEDRATLLEFLRSL